MVSPRLQVRPYFGISLGGGGEGIDVGGSTPDWYVASDSKGGLSQLGGDGEGERCLKPMGVGQSRRPRVANVVNGINTAKVKARR